MSNSFHLPKPRPLPKTSDPCWNEDHYQNLPFLIVGDDAFQLSSDMIKPYSGRNLSEEQIVFNYRLSRFRRCNENAFGIWTARFRIFLSRINVKNLVTINKINLAGVVLHNMLCEKSRSSYIPPYFADTEDPFTGIVATGQWRNEVTQTDNEDPPLVGCRGIREAEKIRDAICDFRNRPGALPWQEQVLK